MVKENAPDNLSSDGEPSSVPQTEEEKLENKEREAHQKYVNGMKAIRRAIMQKARERCDVVRRGDATTAKKIIAAEASLAMVLGEEKEANYWWYLLQVVEAASQEEQKAKQDLYRYKFGVRDILPKG